MTTNQLQKMTAFLESKVDLLETELSHLDEMLRKCGFPEGIASLKLAVAEVLKSKNPPEIDPC
jgi:hypothetical protein